MIFVWRGEKSHKINSALSLLRETDFICNREWRSSSLIVLSRTAEVVVERQLGGDSRYKLNCKLASLRERSREYAGRGPSGIRTKIKHWPQKLSLQWSKNLMGLTYRAIYASRVLSKTTEQLMEFKSWVSSGKEEESLIKTFIIP